MPPRQKIRVVLHLGDQHLTPVESRFGRRDPVQRVGRPLDEDDDLVFLIHVEEPRDKLPRLLVCLGREPRLVAGSAVHARVQVGKCGDHVADSVQRWRAGGVVEVDPGRGRAAVNRDGQVDPGEVLAPLSGVGGGHAGLNLTPSWLQVESVSFTLAKALSMVSLTRVLA